MSSQETLKSKIEKLKKELSTVDNEMKALQEKKNAIKKEIVTREEKLRNYYQFDPDDFERFLMSTHVHTMINNIFSLVDALDWYTISFSYSDITESKIKICTSNNEIIEIYVDPKFNNTLVVSAKPLNKKLPLNEIYETVTDWLHYHLNHDTEDCENGKG